jgi:hypothetical protein
MTRMIADKSFPYRGVAVREGEAFDVDEEHVALFTKIGQAHVETGTDLGYQTRMMTADKPRRVKRN